MAGHARGAEAAERRPRGRPSAAGFHQFGPCLRRGSGGCLCPKSSVRAVPPRLLLLCLLLRSSWLTVEGGRHGAVGVRHRRGGRAALAVSVSVGWWRSNSQLSPPRRQTFEFSGGGGGLAPPARRLVLVHFATLAHGARRGRVPADAEVGQRDGSPDARCRNACASEHLVNATMRSPEIAQTQEQGLGRGPLLLPCEGAVSGERCSSSSEVQSIFRLMFGRGCDASRSGSRSLIVSTIAASCRVARRRRRPLGPAGLTAAGLPSAPRR